MSGGLSFRSIALVVVVFALAMALAVAAAIDAVRAAAAPVAQR